jgi:hypothetical protein
MTAIASPALAGRSTPVHRIGSVIRLHFANPATLVVTPFIVLGSIFLINVIIWVIVVISASPKDQVDFAKGFSYSGSSLWIFVYMAVVAIQAMNATFRLALGYGTTRRAYFAGSAIAFAGLSIGYTAVLTVLGLIEQATNGWGLSGRMFTPVYFGASWGDRIAVMLCLFLFFTFAGAAFGAVFVRWNRNGLLIFGGILLTAIVLVGLVVALLQAWDAVFGWIGATPLGGLAAWSLLPTAAFGVIGFLVLRRATPR